nr:MAG TPA: hypothetical protein [Caudoviricetes sp.]
MSKLLYTWKDFYVSPDKIHTAHYYTRHTEADVARRQVMVAKARYAYFVAGVSEAVAAFVACMDKALDDRTLYFVRGEETGHPERRVTPFTLEGHNLPINICVNHLEGYNDCGLYSYEIVEIGEEELLTKAERDYLTKFIIEVFEDSMCTSHEEARDQMLRGMIEFK